MALWRIEMAYPDGRRVTNIIAAGNRDAALARATAAAQRHGATLVAGPTVTDPVRGTL